MATSGWILTLLQGHQTVISHQAVHLAVLGTNEYPTKIRKKIDGAVEVDFLVTLHVLVLILVVVFHHADCLARHTGCKSCQEGTFQG